jgi:hypothetical protein
MNYLKNQNLRTDTTDKTFTHGKVDIYVAGQKMFTFYGNRRFIAVSIKDRQWTLYRASSIHPTPPSFSKTQFHIILPSTATSDKVVLIISSCIHVTPIVSALILMA